MCQFRRFEPTAELNTIGTLGTMGINLGGYAGRQSPSRFNSEGGYGYTM